MPRKYENFLEIRNITEVEATKGCTIDAFAIDLVKYRRQNPTGQIVGIFNDIRLEINIGDKTEGIVDKYLLESFAKKTK